MKTRRKLDLLVALAVALLGFGALVCIPVAVLWFPWYPSVSANFSFTKFGFWGDSPDEIVDVARRSNDVGEVYAALDALALIGLHYDNRLDTKLRAFDAIKVIYDLADGQWSNRPPKTKDTYVPLGPWHEYGQEHGLTFGESVKLGVFSSVSSIRDIAHSDGLESLRVKCDMFLLEIKPPRDSPLLEVWLKITRPLQREGSDALEELKEAVQHAEGTRGAGGHNQ